MVPVNVLPLPPNFFLSDLVGNCFCGAFPATFCFRLESLALFSLLPPSSDNGHFLAAFADCDVAAAKAENGLCFHALDCFPGTPTGFVEVGALPLPCDTPSLGAVPAGGTAPPPPPPMPFLCSFAAFSNSLKFLIFELRCLLCLHTIKFRSTMIIHQSSYYYV